VIEILILFNLEELVLHTHIASGTGKDDLSVEEIEREVREEDMSSADSAGGSLSCRVFRWFGAFPRPIAKRSVKTL